MDEEGDAMRLVRGGRALDDSRIGRDHLDDAGFGLVGQDPVTRDTFLEGL